MTLLKYYISYNTHFQIKTPAKQIQKGNVYHTRIHTYSHTYMHKCWSRILEQDQQFWRRDPSSQLVVILLTPKGRKVEQVLADVWTLNIKPQQKMLISILPSMPMTLVTYHHAHECVCVNIDIYCSSFGKVIVYVVKGVYNTYCCCCEGLSITLYANKLLIDDTILKLSSPPCTITLSKLQPLWQDTITVIPVLVFPSLYIV